jgi:hypothetical protein
MDEIKFTEEELAILNGEGLDEEEEPVQPGDTEPEAVEESPAEEVEEEEAPKEAEVASKEQTVEELRAELEKARKSTEGILNELVTTRKKWRGDREWREQVEQRMAMLAEKVEPQEEVADPDEEPDRNEDPLAWLDWRQKQYVNEQMQPVAEMQEQAQVQAEYTQLLSEAAQMVEAAEEDLFKTGAIEKDDYYKKLDQLRVDRGKWYVAGGMDPKQAEQMIAEEERQFVFSALSQGINPAAEVLAMYERLYGGEQQQEAPKQESPTPKKVQSVKAGVKQQGLQNVPDGGVKSGTITAEEFAELDPKDPIFKKIAGDETLFARLNIYGEVNI